MSSPNPPPAQYQQPVHQTVIVHVPQVSTVLPALVNAFCVPGLGQLIQGRLIAAIVWWLLYGLAGLSVFVGVGLILLPLCWVACILDAATYNPTASSGGSGLGAFIIGGAAAVVCAVLLLALLGVFAFSTASKTSTARQTPSPSQIELPPEPLNAEAYEPQAQTIATTSTDNPWPQPSTINPPEASVAPAKIEQPEKPKLRSWTSRDGKFSTTAEFKSMGAGKVKLIKQDGAEIEVPLDKLSDEDERWIRNYHK
jgi:hypothetical protein